MGLKIAPPQYCTGAEGGPDLGLDCVVYFPINEELTMKNLIVVMLAGLLAAPIGAYAAEKGMTDLEKERRTTDSTPKPKDLSEPDKPKATGTTGEKARTELEKQRQITEGTPKPKDLSTEAGKGTIPAPTTAADCSKLTGDAREACLDRVWLRKQRSLSDTGPRSEFKEQPGGGYAAASKRDCEKFTGAAKEECLDNLWLRHQRRASEGTPKGDPVSPPEPEKKIRKESK